MYVNDTIMFSEIRHVAAKETRHVAMWLWHTNTYTHQDTYTYVYYVSTIIRVLRIIRIQINTGMWLCGYSLLILTHIKIRIIRIYYITCNTNNTYTNQYGHALWH